MYLPESFNEQDRELVLDTIDQNGFATLISWTGANGGAEGGACEPVVSHLPLMVERRPDGLLLLGHLARANPHWQLFDGKTPALTIFSGPHAYISPAWYETTPAVPTWNYVVVHVHGRPELVDAAATRDIVALLVEKHQRARVVRWSGVLPPDFLADQLGAIVGFRIPIDKLEAKFKLGQSRTAADRAGTIAGLEREADRGSHELAAFTRHYYASKEKQRGDK
jgi:transcriptional regulator